MNQANEAVFFPDADTVAILFHQEESMYSFTAREMKKRFEGTKYRVELIDMETGSIVTTAHRIVLTTRAEMEAQHFPGSNELSLPESKPEGYSVRKIINKDHIVWYIVGFDKSGAMYGGLDFADEIQYQGFSSYGDNDIEPYIASRGIKLNVPLDARTPSYSDSGDSAQENIENMWEMSFWCDFLDEMAKCKLNTLSLWNLHPFPSMVKVPSYPNVALQDVMKTTSILTPDLMGREMSTAESLESLQLVKRMSMEEKIGFWRAVMAYAQDRGVDVYLFTWNTFVYGTEHSGYDFTTSVSDDHTVDYFRKSVDALIRAYPLLKGIGITAGENMSRDATNDEMWLFNTYGKGICDALARDENRSFRLIHRIQFANISTAMNSFSSLNSRCTLETSFKYSQAHLYSSTKPGYIHENDDAYFNDIGTHKTWLALRDDDYYMLRGGSDPEFIRSFIKGMPYEKMQGYYIGADGYTWGREYIAKNPESPRSLVMQKRWYSFMLWGSLTYQPGSSDERFVHMLKARFPTVDASVLFRAWAKASQVLPLVNRFHNENCQLDFQWVPEACTSLFGFHDINSFINCAPQMGEGIVGIAEYVENRKNGVETKGETPESVTGHLWETARYCLTLIQGMKGDGDKELNDTIEDIKAMAYLGQYYSRKILGAMYKCMADKESDAEKKNTNKKEAVRYLEEASAYWSTYATTVSNLYKPQTLTRLVAKDKGVTSPPRYMDVLALQRMVDQDIEIVGYNGST